MAATAAEQQQFYLLLGNLLSPDNVVRKQAEVSELAAPRLRAPAGVPALPRRRPAGSRPMCRGCAGRAGRAVAAEPTCEAARGSQPCPRALPVLAAAAPGASFLPSAPCSHVRPLLTRCPRPVREAGRRGGMWGVGRAPRCPRPLPAFSQWEPPPPFQPSPPGAPNPDCCLTHYPCFSPSPLTGPLFPISSF